MPDDAKVLVVDDDPVTRTCLAEYFAAENYEVLVAGTAEEAGRLAAIEDVDLGQRLRITGTSGHKQLTLVMPLGDFGLSSSSSRLPR